MSNQIVFTTMKSPSDNRAVEQDDKGYYKVTLGSLNAANSEGKFYSAEGVTKLLTEDSSSLARRLTNGSLKGEVGHPAFLPGMTKGSFYALNMRITLPNTSHHIRDIVITDTDIKSDMPGGDKVILIEGWIKPSGPHGDALKAALDNPEENVSFSIRCFTAETMVNGSVIKKILQIITWDWVNEPGMAEATKWKRLSIEDKEVYTLDLEDLSEDGETINECFNCSLESADERNVVTDIISNYKRVFHKEDVIHNW